MLKIKKVTQDNVVILRLSGELNFHTSTELRAVLEEVVSDEFRALLINFDELSLIDSSGIGMLLLASKEMEKKNRKTILIAHQFVWELLNITKLTEFFEKASNEKEAEAIAARSA
ncbi:MAG: STAS domain-containing protein [Actinobacteria bacterium]|nr:STAS domain-containing protein [Actinomycetota bacterium]